MLTVIEQPRIFCPVSKSRPVRWVLHTNAHIIENGNNPNFSIIFNEQNAADGEEVTLLGQTFTVDNSTPYTESTWSTDGTQQEVTENFINMLRCSYAFRDWTLFVSFFPTTGSWRGGGFYNRERTELSPFEWDLSGLSINVAFNETNGWAAELRNLRVWYRVFRDDGTAITDELSADIPYDPNFPLTGSRVTIDATKAIRGLLATERPQIFQGTEFEEPNFIRGFYLRFAEVEVTGGCDEIGGKVYQTQQAMVTNTVYGLRDRREFRQHCPDRNRPARFITSRPDVMNVCGNTYEWIHFYWEENSYFIAPCRIRYEFFNKDNQQLNSYDREFAPPSEAVYRIGIGTANAEIANNIVPGTAYYTFQVFSDVNKTDGITEEVPVTVQNSRRIENCNCKVAEVYFLEDTGSWQTVTFEKVVQRAQEAEALEFETPLDYRTEKGFLTEPGGRYSETVEADNPFTFETEKLTPSNRERYEELLRSPRHYIRTVDTNNQEALRRIVIERAATVTARQGEVVRLQITFRYNARTPSH